MRILNEEGHRQYAAWVYSLKEYPNSSIPANLLQADETSYQVYECERPKHQIFITKYDLVEQVTPLIISLQTIETDPAVWPRIWDSFALLYFDSICDAKDGTWKVLSSERYLFKTTGKMMQVPYRHHIFGPCRLYSVNAQAMKGLYSTIRPFQHTEFEENVGSRIELASSYVMIELFKKLYITSDGKLKKGTKSSECRFNNPQKKQYKAGTISRAANVCKQFSRTYDLHGMNLHDLVKLLPSNEFATWLK